MIHIENEEINMLAYSKTLFLKRKKIVSFLLAFCSAFTLLSITAPTKIQAAGTVITVTLDASNDPDCTTTSNYACKYGVDKYGYPNFTFSSIKEGITLHIINNVTSTPVTSVYWDVFPQSGAQFKNVFYVNGDYDGGDNGSVDTYTAVGNFGNITGGTYISQVDLFSGGKISTGLFNSDVFTDENTIINGGTFNGTHPMSNQGTINGGTFNLNLGNFGTINNGIFNNDVSSVTTTSVINGGTYNGNVNNHGLINGGTFKAAVTNTNTGVINNGVFEKTIDNAGTVTDGTFVSGITGTPATKKLYKVTLSNATFNNSSATTASVGADTKVSVTSTVTPFASWSITPSTLTLTSGTLTDSTITFTMPASDVTIEAVKGADSTPANNGSSTQTTTTTTTETTTTETSSTDWSAPDTACHN
jgi:hypothetical protein